MNLLVKIFILGIFTLVSLSYSQENNLKDYLMHAKNKMYIKKLNIDKITSFYCYSNLEKKSKKQLPVIIFIGHPGHTPKEYFSIVWGKFQEPVLLIWSGLLDELRSAKKDIAVENKKLWSKKSKIFPKLIKYYTTSLNIDPSRIYLTGFSFDAVYSWMLAYDHPELYAGVVAMSSVSYPLPIQNKLYNSSQVVTVVVRGEKDHFFRMKGKESQERKTGKIIESNNANSKWIFKKGETHKGVAKYWVKYLNYILQFTLD